ncbi:hypothetical protein, partial [Chryseobacterium koreense]|uniref:hypothetical protein n=1 Tax=Chryseobacterium koreense TaxID=232216 RepID=UPI0026E9A07D
PKFKNYIYTRFGFWGRLHLEVNFDPANRNTFLPAGIKIYFHLLNHQQFSLFHLIPSLSSISVSNYISYIHYCNVYFWNLLCVKYLFCLQLTPKNTKVSPPKINNLFILKRSLLKDYSFISGELKVPSLSDKTTRGEAELSEAEA